MNVMVRNVLIGLVLTAPAFLGAMESGGGAALSTVELPTLDELEVQMIDLQRELDKLPVTCVLVYQFQLMMPLQRESIYFCRHVADRNSGEIDADFQKIQDDIVVVIMLMQGRIRERLPLTDTMLKAKIGTPGIGLGLEFVSDLMDGLGSRLEDIQRKIDRLPSTHCCHGENFSQSLALARFQKEGELLATLSRRLSKEQVLALKPVVGAEFERLFGALNFFAEKLKFSEQNLASIHEKMNVILLSLDTADSGTVAENLENLMDAFGAMSVGLRSDHKRPGPDEDSDLCDGVEADDEDSAGDDLADAPVAYRRTTDDK